MHSGPTKGTLWTSRVAQRALWKALACTSPPRGAGTRGARGLAPLWAHPRALFWEHFSPPWRIQNLHRFQGLFGEHSASSPDWRRCSLAGKLQGQLDVDHFAPEPFRRCSRTTFGVRNAASGSSLPPPEWLKTRCRYRRPPWGHPGPSVQATWAYSLPLRPWLPALIYIYIYNIYIYIYNI